jgi:hypothetical protein
MMTAPEPPPPLTFLFDGPDDARLTVVLAGRTVGENLAAGVAVAVEWLATAVKPPSGAHHNRSS